MLQGSCSWQPVTPRFRRSRTRSAQETCSPLRSTSPLIVHVHSAVFELLPDQVVNARGVLFDLSSQRVDLGYALFELLAQLTDTTCILFELVAQRVDSLHELTEIPNQVVRILALPLQPRNVLARYYHGPFGPLALFELRVFSELDTVFYSLFGLFYFGGGWRLLRGVLDRSRGGLLFHACPWGLSSRPQVSSHRSIVSFLGFGDMAACFRNLSFSGEAFALHGSPGLVIAQKEYYGHHPPEGGHLPVAKVLQHAVGRELNEDSPSRVPLEAYLLQKTAAVDSRAPKPRRRGRSLWRTRGSEPRATTRQRRLCSPESPIQAR